MVCVQSTELDAEDVICVDWTRVLISFLSRGTRLQFQG